MKCINLSQIHSDEGSTVDLSGGTETDRMRDGWDAPRDPFKSNSQNVFQFPNWVLASNPDGFI
jgi:hypothetical protein